MGKGEKKKKKEAFILKSTISGKTSSQARVAELHKLSRIYKQNPLSIALQPILCWFQIHF